MRAGTRTGTRGRAAPAPARTSGGEPRSTGPPHSSQAVGETQRENEYKKMNRLSQK